MKLSFHHLSNADSQPLLARVLSATVVALLVVSLALPGQRATAAPATVAPPTGDVHYLVGSFTKPTGPAPVTQAIIHNMGVRPKVLMLWTTGQTAQNVASSYRYAMGFSDGVTSYSFAAASRHNVSPSNASQRFAAKALTVAQWGEALSAEADLVGWDTTTFTLRWTTNNSSDYVINYLLIGGTGVTAKVLNWQAPTVTGAYAVTGVGFRPDLVFHLNGAAELTGAAPISQPGANYGYGLMNVAGEQGVIANMVKDDAGATPMAVRGQRVDAAVAATTIAGASGAFTVEGSYVSMDADGFTLHFSRVAGPMQIA